MKLSVRNRRSGSVQFTAEIDCAEDEVSSVKLGLAVKWGIKHGADLRHADLRCAELSDAELSYADLSYANLNLANLNFTSLRYANLNFTSLRYANLNYADLSFANLNSADLNFANLNFAKLRDTNLNYANLSFANLSFANLNFADLRGANLDSVSGLNSYIKSIQLETYAITYTSDVMQIGCERHLISEWAEFDDKRILEMDGKDALKFWRKYKSWIFQAIELAPAKPTKTDEVA